MDLDLLKDSSQIVEWISHLTCDKDCLSGTPYVNQLTSPPTPVIKNSDTGAKLTDLADYSSPKSIPNCQNCSQKILDNVIELLLRKPNYIDDKVRHQIIEYHKSNSLKVRNLISIVNIQKLAKTKFPTTTWLKYETLLTDLIKANVYEAEAVANEALSIVKNELNPELSRRFSSVLGTCVKHCRQDDTKGEEKWSEIIDWLSWFVNSGDVDNDL